MKEKANLKYSKVSLVVLSWNKLADTKVCLKSIRNIDYENYEIIVVDNGSTDGSKDWLSKQKDIIYVDLPQNTGFTGGQLAAYKVSKGEYLALINNDAVISPDWVKQSLKSFEKDQKVAAVGGRAYIFDKQHKAYDVSSPFYSYQVIDPIRGYAETMMCGEESAEVNSISGAGVMISRKAIEKVGYFDDVFFAYYEETDLFARMKRAGYKIIYNPGMHAWHKIGQSTKSQPFFYLYYMHRNRFIFAYKNFDKEYLKKFTKYYRKDFAQSIKKSLLGRSSLDDKARIKAYLWIIRNQHLLHNKRSQVQAYGNIYNTKLVKDESQNVSVIITCYNYAKYVEKAITSALSQSQKPREVIVINDGSTDNSMSIINKYRNKIKVIDKKNEGVIKSKNLGKDISRGYWTIFLDADDYIDKDYIKILLQKARLNDSDLVYTDMKLFGHFSKIFRAVPYSKKILLENNFINNSAMMKTDIIKQVGGYKNEMKNGYEDWELYLSFAEINIKASYIPKPLLFYRQHPSNNRNALATSDSEALRKTVVELHPRLYNFVYKSKKFIKIKISKFNFSRLRFIFLSPKYLYSIIITSNKRRSLMMNKSRRAYVNFKKQQTIKYLKSFRVRSTIKSFKELLRYYYRLGNS